MSRRPILLVLLCAVGLALVACSDDNVTRVLNADLVGRVYLDETGVAEASVFLLRDYGLPPMPAPGALDSTYTDARGLFSFSGLDDGSYVVYAGVWAAGGGFRQVSAMSDNLNVGDKSSSVIELSLIPVAASGDVAGTVNEMFGGPVEPSVGAEVTLHRYEGDAMVETSATTTDEAGHYAFGDIATGNYIAYATKIANLESPYPSVLTGESENFFCDGSHATTAPDFIISDTNVDKPALYLYPEQSTDFTVRLRLGRGVRLTASIPEYGDGWRVNVEPSGRIDGQYDYLFYELGMAGWLQVPHGWCLRGDDLENGLRRVVSAFGLNEAESSDFLAYWLERLPRRAWYAVHPLVDEELGGLAALDITPAPDSVLRLWLLFEGHDKPVELPSPPGRLFWRQGIVAVEWGGAVAP